MMQKIRIVVRLPKFIIDGHVHGLRHKQTTTLLEVLLDALRGMIAVSIIMPNSPRAINNLPMLKAVIKILEHYEGKLHLPPQRIWFGATDWNLVECKIAMESDRVVGVKVYPIDEEKGAVTTGGAKAGVAYPEITLPRLFKAARREDKAVAIHSADPRLMFERKEDTIEGEVRYDRRWLDMARDVPGVKIYKPHLSNSISGRLMEKAIVDEGMRLMIEICPHYWWFTKDGLNWNPNLPSAAYKCLNGIREFEHAEYLRELPERLPGNVVVCSDDARHPKTKKEQVWEKAPGGFPGNKHLVRSVVTLGHQRGWSEEIYDQVLSRNISQFLNIDIPKDYQGYREVELELAPDDTVYNGGNVINPYLDMEMFQLVA